MLLQVDTTKSELVKARVLHIIGYDSAGQKGKLLKRSHNFYKKHTKQKWGSRVVNGLPPGVMSCEGAHVFIKWNLCLMTMSRSVALQPT